MGRHSDGKSNYAVSANAIVAIVVVITLIAAAVWWFFLRSDSTATTDTADSECSAGELQLPIAESQPGLADQLIARFADSDPVVDGHCVTPAKTDDISQAAVYVSAGADDAALAESGRTSEGPAQTIHVPVGLATNAGQTDPAAAEVAYPVASHEDAAVVAAAALTDTPEEAAGLLQRDEGLTLDDALADDAPAIAVKETDTPEGYDFNSLNAAAEYQVVTLNATDEVSAAQVSSADAMVTFAEENAGEAPDNNVSAADAAAVREAFQSGAGVAPEPEVAENPETVPEPEVAPAVGEPVDTLFLLETSEQMNADFGDRSRFEAGADAIAQIAPRLGETGRASSLWNYSSPLSPGVTQGHRNNVGFGRGTPVADSVQLLGTGGVPQTREAVTAALQRAADRSAEIGGPVKVMLFTSGTDATMSDEEFRTVLDNIPAEVDLTAFHLGGGEVDQVLNPIQVNNYQELEGLVNQSLGL